MLRCIFGPNLVILAWTADELWGGQAQNEVKFDFQVKFDLEGQGRSSPKTIGTLTKVFCTFVPNLVILAWTSGELSCGQARDWHTHTRTHEHTDTQTQATTIPEGQNWPRVKMKCWVLSHWALPKTMKWMHKIFSWLGQELSQPRVWQSQMLPWDFGKHPE